MKTIILLAFSAMLFSCNNSGTNSYENAKLTVEQQEKLTPANFLSASGTTWLNLIGETVVEGDVKSTATLAQYKDVVILVSFLTKTDTYLGNKKFVIYEFVNPLGSVHFKVKMFAPDGTQKIKLDIESAQVAE